MLTKTQTYVMGMWNYFIDHPSPVSVFGCVYLSVMWRFLSEPDVHIYQYLRASMDAKMAETCLPLYESACCYSYYCLTIAMAQLMHYTSRCRIYRVRKGIDKNINKPLLSSFFLSLSRSFSFSRSLFHLLVHVLLLLILFISSCILFYFF